LTVHQVPVQEEAAVEIATVSNAMFKRLSTDLSHSTAEKYNKIE